MNSATRPTATVTFTAHSLPSHDLHPNSHRHHSHRNHLRLFRPLPSPPQLSRIAGYTSFKMLILTILMTYVYYKYYDLCVTWRMVTLLTGSTIGRQSCQYQTDWTTSSINSFTRSGMTWTEGRRSWRTGRRLDSSLSSWNSTSFRLIVRQVFLFK